MPQDVVTNDEALSINAGGNGQQKANAKTATPFVAANQTTVSATLKDLGGTTWVGASITINFVPAPNIPGPYMWGGGPFTLRPQLTADQNGYFSIALPDNTTITPAGSTWQFVISPAATMPAVIFNLMIAGSAMDISSIFTSQSYQVSLGLVQSLPLPRAYRDSELATPPNPGQLYFNTSEGRIRIWYPRPGGQLGWNEIGAPAPVTAPAGAIVNVNLFVNTGNYTFSNVDQAASVIGIPAPTDRPLDRRWILLEVSNTGNTTVVNIGDPGHVIQRIYSAYNYDAGLMGDFYIRAYADFGGVGIYQWSAWNRYPRTDTVPTQT